VVTGGEVGGRSVGFSTPVPALAGSDLSAITPEPALEYLRRLISAHTLAGPSLDLAFLPQADAPNRS